MCGQVQNYILTDLGFLNKMGISLILSWPFTEKQANSSHSYVCDSSLFTKTALSVKQRAAESTTRP